MKRIIGSAAALLLTVSLPVSAESLEGRLQWLQRVELSTLTSGVVDEVTVSPGDAVSKGDILLRLDQSALRQAVKNAEANLAYQREAFAEAERELERSQELYDRTLLSDHDLQLAKIAFARARAALEGAQAARAEARQTLRYSAVRAPFDGIVLSRQVEPGQTVVTRLQSVPLLVVAGTERMLARVQAEASRLATLREGMAVEVEVAGQRYRGELYHIGLEPVEPGMDRYPVDVVFSPDSAGAFRVGQRASVHLP